MQLIVFYLLLDIIPTLFQAMITEIRLTNFMANNKVRKKKVYDEIIQEAL